MLLSLTSKNFRLLCGVYIKEMLHALLKEGCRQFRKFCQTNRPPRFLWAGFAAPSFTVWGKLQGWEKRFAQEFETLGLAKVWLGYNFAPAKRRQEADRLISSALCLRKIAKNSGSCP